MRSPESVFKLIDPFHPRISALNLRQSVQRWYNSESINSSITAQTPHTTQNNEPWIGSPCSIQGVLSQIPQVQVHKRSVRSLVFMMHETTLSTSVVQACAGRNRVTKFSRSVDVHTGVNRFVRAHVTRQGVPENDVSAMSVGGSHLVTKRPHLCQNCSHVASCSS